jgi:histidinol phosphatase-like enzyme
VVAQKSTKTVPGNDGKKNMSEMNLFYIIGDTAQDLEAGQSRWEKAKLLSTRNFEGS